MISLKGKRVLLYPGYTDFRYGINGLSLLVGERLEGVVYAFCGKSKRSLKLLEFEKDAVWLTQVKLARGRFQFPMEGEATYVEAEDLFSIINSALATARVESGKRVVGSRLF